MWQSHESLRDDYQVSCAELDFLVECAKDMENIVLGARMTGGGFGGSAVNLVKRRGLDKFTKNIKSSYQRKFGIETTIIISDPVDGASEIDFLNKVVIK